MNIIKQEAKNLIDKLPDNVTWDDIMYELYVNKKISTGLKAAEEGRAYLTRMRRRDSFQNET